MVVRITLFLFLFPLFLFSGEFSARLQRDQLTVGESFQLNLTLKDASATGKPNNDSIGRLFFIDSERQSTNVLFVNGKFTSQTTWTLTLIPREEGKIVIPPVEIETSDGILSTQPITVTISKANPSTEDDGVVIETSLSNATPYKNEPFTYTVKIRSKSNLANLGMQKIEPEHALVEMIEEPKIYKETVGDSIFNVVESSYLVTPLQPGVLTIPSAMIKGMILTQNPSRRTFDDPFGLFSGMHGFDQAKSFIAETKEMTVDVQPAIPGIVPWLPAKSLTIEDASDRSQTLREGEPFAGILRISAVGLPSVQLPDLNDLQLKDGSFKIYADKPELHDERHAGTINGSRTERYTLIPQRSGMLELPEISVVWWDVTKKERAIARIPARTFEVLPSLDKNGSQTHSKNESSSLGMATEAKNETNQMLLAGSIGAGILLLAAIAWVVILQKKINRLTKNPEEADRKNSKKKEKKPKTEIKAPLKDKYEKLSDLNPT